MSHDALSTVPPVAPTRLILIRHGEVEVKYQRVFGGRIDMDLSPRGHDQAKTLAKWLDRQPIKAVYASPMKRVQQTLAPYLAGKVPAPTVMHDLREVDFGDWTGLTWEGVHDKFGVSAYQWLHELDRGAIPNAETGATYRARIEPCIRQILKAHPSETVLIACHGGVIRMVLSILLHLPLPKCSVFDVEYASATRIELFPHKTELQLLNFVPWMEAGL